MPFDVFLTIVIVLLASFIYAKTTFGWNVLALGGNEEAARLAGIKTKAMKSRSIPSAASLPPSPPW